ncbi:Gamma-butyrobetaine dioxygenase [Armadillidium vulgare]|nr:Gamma-butyrobetaine dioxygenase [Armadillidium vulgare]
MFKVTSIVFRSLRPKQIENLNLKAVPTEIKTSKNVLEVSWNDGHSSTFDSAWLYERAFNDQARTKYDKLYRLPMKPWGKNLQLSIFNYEDITRNDSSLLNWLLTMEVTGATLIKNCPNDLEAGPKLSEKIGFVKMTHYGTLHRTPKTRFEFGIPITLYRTLRILYGTSIEPLYFCIEL